MYYHVSINTLSNITENNAIKTVLEIDAGTIQFIDVIIPPGACGLMHVTVKYHTIQILPFNPTGTISGDSMDTRYDIYYDVTEPPNEIEIMSYNLDDTYDHTIYIGVMVEHANSINLDKLYISGGV